MPSLPENQPPPRTWPVVLAGIDEAGRGPLAGPVVAAAVVFAPGQSIPGVRDSKQLSPARRERLAERIRAEALAFALGLADPAEIDAHNILNATFLAMRRAFAALPLVPERVQVDGNRVPDLAPYRGPVEAVVGGDRYCPAISAASILAKVHRDALMLELHARFPGYGFDQHKGYPTPLHQEALRRLGPCPEHRRSFGPVREALGVPSPAGLPGARAP